MSKHPFLSDEWITDARAIRAEFRGKVPSVPVSVRMNQIVTDVPFGGGTLHAHLDTSSGEVELETGHLDSPDVTITLDYTTAKAMLIDGDPTAGMQAFMSGRIKVDGDMTKLILIQQSGLFESQDPGASEAYQKVRDITA